MTTLKLAYVIVCLFHCFLLLYYPVYITALMCNFIMLLLLLKSIQSNSIKFNSIQWALGSVNMWTARERPPDFLLGLVHVNIPFKCVFMRCLAMSPASLDAAMEASALSEIAWNCFVSRSTCHACESTRAAIASVTEGTVLPTAEVLATKPQKNRTVFMASPPFFVGSELSYYSILSSASVLFRKTWHRLSAVLTADTAMATVCIELR